MKTYWILLVLCLLGCEFHLEIRTKPTKVDPTPTQETPETKKNWWDDHLKEQEHQKSFGVS